MLKPYFVFGPLLLTLFTNTASALPPYVPYKNETCGLPKGQNELRLDRPNKGAPVVNTRVIDQGSVGDCYAAAATCSIESVWNKNGKTNTPEVSYFASALQSRLDYIEKNALTKLDEGEVKALSSQERIDLLKRIAQETHDNDLLIALENNVYSKSEIDELIITQNAMSRLKNSRKTLMDGLDICEVIHTLNQEGYCPKNKIEIEEAISTQHASNDKDNAQGTLVNAIENLYLGLYSIKKVKDSLDDEKKEQAKKLLALWIPHIQSLTLPEKSSAPLCDELSQALQPLKSAIQNLKTLSRSAQYQQVIGAALSSIKTGDEVIKIKSFLMSAMMPQCDSQEKRIQLKPKLKCTSEHFPSKTVLRYNDETIKERQDAYKIKLGGYWDEANSRIQKGATVTAQCKTIAYNQDAPICNHDQSQLVSRDEFVNASFAKRNKKSWLTSTDKNWTQLRGDISPNSPDSQIGILPNRVMNLGEIAKEFDDKVTTRLIQDGLPMGVSICSSVLEAPNLDGKNGVACIDKNGVPEDTTHAVQVIGVRKSGSGGCEYLIKDSRGTDMSYSQRCKNYTAKIKRGESPTKNGVPIDTACEPGLIWVPSPDLSVNTGQFYTVDGK